MTPYSYELPDSRIAQRPVRPPEAAKMMIVNRTTGAISHERFSDICAHLRPSDHLVFNDTKVIPARLFGRLENGEGYPIEVVLLREEARHEWSALGFPMRRIREAASVYFNSNLEARVLPSPTMDRLRLRFVSSDASRVGELIHEHGTMPIPPYIRDGRGDELDRVDYQSIFALHPGSVAAPTASLHFSPELMSNVRALGCKVDTVTLHVGTASFQPIFVQGVLRLPGEERFEVSPELLASLQETKRNGGRVIAVGTTVVRALESASTARSSGETELFIQPGFQFSLLDSLITNFHQPRTTHLLLVEALLGGSLLHAAYTSALATDYRFLSYGDGMFIV